MGPDHARDRFRGALTGRVHGAPLYSLARMLQLSALVVTGVGLWMGLLGGKIRLELALLAVASATFLLGRWLQGRAR